MRAINRTVPNRLYRGLGFDCCIVGDDIYILFFKLVCTPRHLKSDILRRIFHKTYAGVVYGLTSDTTSVDTTGSIIHTIYALLCIAKKTRQPALDVYNVGKHNSTRELTREESAGPFWR